MNLSSMVLTLGVVGAVLSATTIADQVVNNDAAAPRAAAEKPAKEYLKSSTKLYASNQKSIVIENVHDDRTIEFTYRVKTGPLDDWGSPIGPKKLVPGQTLRAVTWNPQNHPADYHSEIIRAWYAR